MFTLETFYEQQHQDNLLNGFLFGSLLAFMVYNLYLYIVIKDLSCLYYLAYLFFALLFLLSSYGYVNKLSIYGFGLHQISLLIAAVFLILAGYVKLKKGFGFVVYYLAAVVCLLLCYTLYAIYAGQQTAMGLQLGLCLQALVLSFALAVELNQLKKETGNMQQEMMDQTAGFSRELISGQEKERETIAGELNNRVGQQLVLLKNEVFILRRLSSGAQEEVFKAITVDIGKTIEEISNVSFSLRPYQMDTLGLKLSVEHLVENIAADTDVAIELDIGDINHLLDIAAGMNVYRMVQELLNNLIKHAGALSCNISIKLAGAYLVLYYHDNGKGYDTSGLGGMGLKGIHERCAMMGAGLTVSSILGKGTRVYIKIPVDKMV